MNNKDLLLFRSLKKIILPFGDILNIYFTYKKVKKGCFIDIDEDNSKKFENILKKYNFKYNIYKEKFKKNNNLYFISKTINPKNIDFFESSSIKNKLNDIKLGKFLGYGCIHNLTKDLPCKNGYLLSIVYNDNDNNETIYGFCCNHIMISVINKTLKIIEKMNYYIKKYLFTKLKGYVKLEIIKL